MGAIACGQIVCTDYRQGSARKILNGCGYALLILSEGNQLDVVAQIAAALLRRGDKEWF
jgi:hypothetical protein